VIQPNPSSQEFYASPAPFEYTAHLLGHKLYGLVVA